MQAERALKGSALRHRLPAWQRERNTPAEFAATLALGCCAGIVIGRNMGMYRADATLSIANRWDWACMMRNERRNRYPEVPRMRD